MDEHHPPVLCEFHEGPPLSGEHNERHPQLWAEMRRDAVKDKLIQQACVHAIIDYIYIFYY